MHDDSHFAMQVVWRLFPHRFVVFYLDNRWSKKTQKIILYSEYQILQHLCIWIHTFCFLPLTTGSNGPCSTKSQILPLCPGSHLFLLTHYPRISLSLARTSPWYHLCLPPSVSEQLWSWENKTLSGLIHWKKILKELPTLVVSVYSPPLHSLANSCGLPNSSIFQSFFFFLMAPPSTISSSQEHWSHFINWILQVFL